jgi:hypothetical protein
VQPTRALALTAILVAICGAGPGAQGTQRRLTTIDALRQFPGFFHLQNVLVHGEFVENERRISLRGGDSQIRVQLSQNVTASSGVVEVRGQLIDVGRLESGDPRAGNFAEGRESTSWPRPGEELVLQVSAVAPSQPMVMPTLRALALEPWNLRQTVTVTGNFRGRNLFGDLPDAPGKGVTTSSCAAAKARCGSPARGRAVRVRLRRRSPHRQQPLARDHRAPRARPRAGAHRGDEDCPGQGARAQRTGSRRGPGVGGPAQAGRSGIQLPDRG